MFNEVFTQIPVLIVLFQTLQLNYGQAIKAAQNSVQNYGPILSVTGICISSMDVKERGYAPSSNV